MKITPANLRPLVAGALVGFLLTACASERVKAENQRAKANKDDYVDYYPVGSNIPIKVPRDQAKASAKETEDTERGFRDIQRATQQPETGPQSGIPGNPQGVYPGMVSGNTK